MATQQRSLLKSFDIFGKEIQSFNIGGFSTIKSLIGSLTSILVLILLTMYSLLKLEHLISQHNPLIFTNVSPLDEGSSYDLFND